MAKFSLYFVGDEAPELHETVFVQPILGQERRSVRGKRAGAYEGYSTFQWTKAVQGLSVLFLRARMRLSGENSCSFSVPQLIGDNLSLAASLDYALDKQTTWLLDMFGWDRNGLALARRAIYRTNPGRKRKGPVALSLNPNFLPPEDVEIYFNQQPITKSSVLQELCHKILASSLEISEAELLHGAA